MSDEVREVVRPKLSEQMEFARELPLVMNRAHALGLHVTGHALHKAVQKVGYEVASYIEKGKP